MSITPAFCQAASEIYNEKWNMPEWLIISVIVAVILVIIFLIKKALKNDKLIEHLSPDHFTNGKSFDRAVFTSLTTSLQKTAKNTWKVPVVILVMFGFGYLCANGIGGAIGNVLAVLCFLLAAPTANLPMIKTSKKIKTAYKTLGITQKDVNAVIRKLKQETEYDSSKKSDKTKLLTFKILKEKRVLFYTAAGFAMLILVFLIFLTMVNRVPNDKLQIESKTYTISLGEIIYNTENKVVNIAVLADGKPLQNKVVYRSSGISAGGQQVTSNVSSAQPVKMALVVNGRIVFANEGKSSEDGVFTFMVDKAPEAINVFTNLSYNNSVYFDGKSKEVISNQKYDNYFER